MNACASWSRAAMPANDAAYAFWRICRPMIAYTSSTFTHVAFRGIFVRDATIHFHAAKAANMADANCSQCSVVQSQLPIPKPQRDVRGSSDHSQLVAEHPAKNEGNEHH